MKKFFAAAALSLAALLLFAGCSAQITADISSGWLTSPDNGYDPNFYESLDYSVDFVNSETDENLNIDIDSDNSAYNITTEAVGTMSFLMPDGSTATYTNVYHLTMTQTVSATYTYERDNGETLTYTFGGNEDADPDTFEPEDADTVTLEVWFTSLNSTATGTDAVRPAFSPIRSIQTSRTHGATTSIANDSSSFISMYDYSIEILYDQTCQNATLTYTDNFADLTDEERAANEYVRKESTRFPESREIGDLQKNYTCIDNAQLIFIIRGLAMNTDTSHTLTVVSGTANNYPAALSISCSELINSHISFTMVDGEGVEHPYDEEEFPVARMTVSVANAGSYIGENTTITYAQRTSGGSNTYRCLPLRIQIPYGLSVGNYVYTLETASYQAPAEQA